MAGSRKKARFYQNKPDRKCLKKIFSLMVEKHQTVREILLSPSMPSRETFYAWIQNNPDISDEYEAAKAKVPDKRLDDGGYSTDHPDEEVIEYIFNELSQPMVSIAKLLDNPNMPTYTTFYGWLQKNESIMERYMDCRRMQALAYSDMLIDMASDSSGDYRNGEFQKEHVQRTRLKVDTVKFIVAKLLPKIFGDNKNVNVEVSHLHSIPDEQLNKQIAVLQGKYIQQAPGDTARLIEGRVENTS